MPSTIDTWPSKDGLQVGFLNINSARDKKDDISNILCNSGNNFHILFRRVKIILPYAGLQYYYAWL